MEDLDDTAIHPNSSSKLKKLSVHGTQITTDGAICALKNLPDLIYFDFYNTIEAINLLQGLNMQNTHDSSNKPQSRQDLKFQQLQEGKLPIYLTELRGQENDSEEIMTALEASPNVRRVELNLPYGTSEHCLVHLSTLQHISELSLNLENWSQFVCDTCLVPSLKKIGHQLTTLQICSPVNLNLLALSQLCPNIKTLELIIDNHFHIEDSHVVSYTKKSYGFPLLQHVQLVKLQSLGSSSHDLTEHHVTDILSGQFLEYIFIKSMPGLTDNSIKAIVDAHGLPFLEHFEIEDCDSITGSSIDYLLTLKNPCKVVKSSNCKQITRQDFRRFTSFATENKLDVAIEWM